MSILQQYNMKRGDDGQVTKGGSVEGKKVKKDAQSKGNA
jgi:hypothetical protein